MPEAKPARVLTIWQPNPETSVPELVGKASLAEAGSLTLLEARPEQETLLTNMVSNLNRKPVLHRSVPPAPSAPRFSVASLPVSRDDPDFFVALAEYVQKYYGFTLE